MKSTRLTAVLVSIAAIAMVAPDASAFYHPTMGRFLQRDPGAGGAHRIGAGGPAVGDRFVPHDPTGQYADGMNLYQYVQSDPVAMVDPDGLQASQPSSQPTCDCCCAERMDAVVKGKFVGGKTINDYFPDLKGTDFVNNKKPGVAGPFSNKTHIGIQVQLPSDVSGDGKKCSLEQWAWVQSMVVAGRQQMKPGTNIDDMKRSGRDQSKPPFRQYINGSPSMADPVGIANLLDSELITWFTTCVNSGDGKNDKAKDHCKYKKCCVKWKVEIKIDAIGRVTTNNATKGKPWCDKW